MKRYSIKQLRRLAHEDWPEKGYNGPKRWTDLDNLWAVNDFLDWLDSVVAIEEAK